MPNNEDFKKHIKASNKLMVFLLFGIMYGGANFGFSLWRYITESKGIAGMICGMICAVVCFVFSIRTYKSNVNLIVSEKELEIRIMVNQEIQQYFRNL